MRIVQAVGWYFPDRTGGTEVYVSALSRRLTAGGHHVDIVAPEPGGREPRTYLHEGIRVHRFPIPMQLTREQAQGRRDIPGSEWFVRWIASLRPDVVHFHTLVPGLELSEVRAAKAAAARVIATTHSSSLGHICARGTLMHWGEAACDGMAAAAKCAACNLQSRGLSKPMARVVSLVPPPFGEVLRHLPGRTGTALGMSAAMAFNRTRQDALVDVVDRFVLLTAAAAEIVRRNGAPAGKLSLNRLGVDSPGVRKPPPSVRRTTRPVRIGYVGRFDEIKGVFDLVRAMTVLDPSAAIALDIRGPADTNESRAVQAQIARMSADDKRISIGTSLAPADVSTHLASLDVVCCPSVCLEGGPTVALEAHAVGTPVIGTRIGGLAELVTDGVNGRLVAPGDWRALASVLADIAADPSSTVDRWRTALPEPRTMDQVAADYLELYAA